MQMNLVCLSVSVITPRIVKRDTGLQPWLWTTASYFSRLPQCSFGESISLLLHTLNLSISAIIYCFLSTCLGVQIRRSNIREAFRSAYSNNGNAHNYDYDRIYDGRDIPGASTWSAVGDSMTSNEAIELVSTSGVTNRY